VCGHIVVDVIAVIGSCCCCCSATAYWYYCFCFTDDDGKVSASCYDVTMVAKTSSYGNVGRICSNMLAFDRGENVKRRLSSIVFVHHFCSVFLMCLILLCYVVTGTCTFQGCRSLSPHFDGSLSIEMVFLPSATKFALHLVLEEED
jgi:hypothetical protein